MTGEKRVCDSRRFAARRRNSLTPKREISIDASGRTAERYIKRKLNQVLQEGILDSVLPYILSRQQQSIRKHLPVPLPASNPDPGKMAPKVIKRCQKCKNTYTSFFDFSFDIPKQVYYILRYCILGTTICNYN